MKRKQLQRRTGLLCVISIMLLTVALFPALVSSHGTGPHKEASRRTQNAVTSPVDPSNLSRPQTSGAQPTPDAPPFPFLRFIAVLCTGLVINAARLANKFRRFWGLGVFTNFFAFLFLVVGATSSGLPALSEGLLSSNPLIGIKAAPWLADLSGIVVALILPGIRLKSNARPEAESRVRDFEDTPSPNPVLGYIENQIRACITRRIHLELVAASRRFDMNTIKLAARRTLAEEMAMWPLGREDYETARQSIEEFRVESDPRLDSFNKYDALHELLQWCSFKGLISGLNAVANEVQP